MPVSMNRFQRIGSRVATEVLLRVGPALAHSPTLSRSIAQVIEKRIRAHYERHKPFSPLPIGVQEERFMLWLILLRTVERALKEDRLAPSALRGLVSLLIERLILEGGDRRAADRFREHYGVNPPALLTISPGKACNLHCPGCWADAGPGAEKLPWEMVDRIITEAKELWGARFFVLTGGEPLAYRSDGHDVIDLCAKHRDCFFMMYTNGTLITEEVAARLAEMGNLTPAVSLEGWRETTDARRGTGVFDQVAEAMDRLRRYGVLFGVSLTATRHNYKEILSDAFVDYCFQEKGALYGWIFQYMPIGRSITLDLMPTPEQRLWMWKRIRQLARERHLFFADFWNQGTLTEGCIAAGRGTGGGYLYIDWNGAVTPCVFLPYSPVNIKDVYARGGTLNDVWAEPFFASIREWQLAYRQAKGNWMMPCPNRDHHADLRRLIAVHEPEPIDDNAREALLDPEYARGLASYDAAYQSVTDPLWQQEYLGELAS
ncbi:MAG: radical SAM protein [Chloroflexi bacterium]|nr:radical SAM protein [Chloroflexota bacterium]